MIKVRSDQGLSYILHGLLHLLVGSGDYHYIEEMKMNKLTESIKEMIETEEHYTGMSGELVLSNGQIDTIVAEIAKYFIDSGCVLETDSYKSDEDASRDAVSIYYYLRYKVMQ